MNIVIDDMRAADKAGYIAKIVGGEKHFLRAAEQSGYSTSRQKLTFELIEDGIYEICDANFGSSKRNIYFLKIEAGDVVAQAGSLAELIAAEESLPDLEGSAKQISWASSIREKLIAKLKLSNKEIPSWVYSQSSAKFWIDNRDKIGN